MQNAHSILPLAAVLVSLLGPIPIYLSGRTPNVREAWTLLIALTKFLLVASMVPAVLNGVSYTFTIAEVLPGVPIELRVDAMGVSFALVASFLWILTSIYSIGYMRSLKEHDQTRYFASFAVAISATIGVAFAGNLLTLYLFYEVLSLSTYPLVTHEQNLEARASGRKYLTYILGTSIGLALPAMLVTYAVAGTLDFRSGGILAGVAGPELMTVLLLLFVFGFAKAGIMPLHAWLPAAMVAPTPVSSFLHGVAVVKVGVFSILRVIYHILGPEQLGKFDLGAVITTLAAITILVASLIALTQDNLKRRLAYSTVGQLSYMVLGAGMLSASGMLGGTLHIAMHAFGKITLFFCAGAIYVAHRKKYISQMDGLGRQMPVTYLAFLLGSMSIIGLPPLGGFISKWHLLLGAVEAGQLALLLVLIVSSLLNAAYFFPIVYRGFFIMPAGEENRGGIKEAPLLCLVPLSVTALISVALFFYPDLFISLINQALAP
ncbi:monovalent cation/H+ antiporter subunit D family protein [Geoalkalibacter subterraneus]|uniref:Monovalent cation/H+ antiporter subunit D n=1 Tax=Geoalkalibacter subterraneus TaxID=483547 RepID=A0A0B5FB03_9BACT|nr:monovalent cation/H+ antiporter subunit D family protein [Geoalkalibacter subterraneus]AJF05347.1 monovalent cation/H+ antiporter subunit D [Geoalkalibacter subterraneus]